MTTDVFIIDDETDHTFIISELVEALGFNAYVYNNAKTFFNEGKYNDDSIIVLDLNMPEMDGIEVIRKLSEGGSTASLIIVSGSESSILLSAEKLAREHGLKVLSRLSKPLMFTDFNVAINKHHIDDVVVSDKEEEFVPTTQGILKAILRHELVLFYQPQINLKTGKFVCAEALVRWQHPVHGMQFPDTFIKLAEDSDMIGLLSEEVIKMAIAKLDEQKQKGIDVALAVNLSAKDINSLILPEYLEESILGKGLDLNMFTLELTEGALMTELITSLDILTRLRLKGFSLSIDDFGTGFSSLAQLHRIPFSELKIDRSFVMKMAEEEESKAIVDTCIVLAHKLGMKVVAEGIENQEIQDMLTDMGCDIGQGYHISKPLSEDDFEEWLKNNN